jgi:hypothetical protein
MTADTFDLITRYYAAFNAGDMETFLSLPTDDVVHDINQGERETGKVAFAAFMERMNRHYRERLVDIAVMVGVRRNPGRCGIHGIGRIYLDRRGAAPCQRTNLPPECGRVFCCPRREGGPRHQLLQPAGLAETGGRLNAACCHVHWVLIRSAISRLCPWPALVAR